MNHHLSLGQRLIKAMELKNVSSYRINKDTGINKTTIANYLNDEITNPNSSILNQLSQYLNVNLNWLKTGEGTMQIGNPVNSQKNNTPKLFTDSFPEAFLNISIKELTRFIVTNEAVLMTDPVFKAWIQSIENKGEAKAYKNTKAEMDQIKAYLKKLSK